MSIGLKSIGSYIPAASIDNIKQANKFGETEEFIKSKIGAVTLARKDDREETSDLAVKAIKALDEENEAFSLLAIEALVVVTQNPDGSGLPHTSAIVQNKLGLPTNIAAFDVSLGCSGYVYGLYILKGFMEASGLKNGLLVTVDPYSKIVDPDDRVTALLFGDAATASWLGEDSELNIKTVKYGTDGSGAEHLTSFNGRLHMNGRQVFNFAALRVPPQIKSVLSNSNLELSDIDLFCIHQGSNAIVDAISRRFGDSADKFLKDIEHTGNTISSSIPLLLKDQVHDNKVQNILISGFGVGLSWASALLSRSL
ncbi:ketoacyl-ACP synthase III [Neptuniibacter marinus]|uniref:ketoacyl-ACP synthase III n=1 Tax=Neptuniibacter marinus TaxID=1806670 RepID=UPI00082AB2AC|nr:ketoacyl-ACP synthase III [Neptuniibacter marinus]